MVTGPLILAAGSKSPVLAAFGIIELIVIVGWVLMFVILFGLLAINIVSRGRAQRRRPEPDQPATGLLARAVAHPPELAALRRADPAFDEQLLLDAALTATMLMFAASSTGEDAPIKRLATGSFWQTTIGRLTAIRARDRRREGAEVALDRAAGRRVRQWYIPLDYQPSMPELAAVQVGATEHKVVVRVSYSQLQALLRPGAADLAATATATSLPSAAASFGRAFAAQTSNVKVQGVSWIAAGGQFDLVFVRPTEARTNPAAALADRTCTTCGAAYRSELATACAHCGADRPLAWGDWRLADALPV
jgi:hypothetical protein